ncbi:MAG: hypothetical protein QOH47_2389 [Sphingomonadales bacterium]|jgi:hypothetical protein|nr:hypothetical protein [Sphingomonadales bacterium]
MTGVWTCTAIAILSAGSALYATTRWGRGWTGRLH